MLSYIISSGILSSIGFMYTFIETVSVSPILVVYHVDEILAIVTTGLSITMRRNQNCAQHIRGVQKMLTEWRNRDNSRKSRALGTVKTAVLKMQLPRIIAFWKVKQGLK